MPISRKLSPRDVNAFMQHWAVKGGDEMPDNARKLKRFSTRWVKSEIRAAETLEWLRRNSPASRDLHARSVIQAFIDQMLVDGDALATPHGVMILTNHGEEDVTVPHEKADR